MNVAVVAPGRVSPQPVLGGGAMEVVHARCAGLDVHKRTVVACVLRPGPGGSVEAGARTYSTMLGQLEALAAWLGEPHVALEATGVYWKPVYNVLEGDGRWTVLVVNPEHVKAITGRKTDGADAQRLAFLLRHDLLHGSFIPGRAQRELRELTRGRTALVRERARVVQRLEKVLEGANIKLGAVVTELLGASGQRMLDAVLQGVTNPEELAGLAHAKLRPKRELLVEALQGRLTRALRFLVEQHLAHWRELDARVAAYDAEIAEQLRPFDELVTRLDAIPGVGRRTAEIIVTEIGPDVAAFPSPGHLAAWAGVAPGNRQSGGRRKAARTRHGTPWLKAALTESSWAAQPLQDRLPPGPVPAPRRPTWPQARRRRPRPHPRRRHLLHDRPGHPRHRPRLPLLRPSRPRPHRTTRTRHPPQPRLRRHPLPLPSPSSGGCLTTPNALFHESGSAPPIPTTARREGSANCWLGDTREGPGATAPISTSMGGSPREPSARDRPGWAVAGCLPRK